ncbi:hypothetical protein [Leclercia adecarboxylata]|uniref:hypothetical protein n=1 Tax=Leclercia adecarboxylata TaxID=83655 RepID=UPI003D2C2BDF
MAWQGIPFKLLVESTGTIDLAVSALPNLVLKSDPDYTTAFITGMVSLVAGLIPAGIAVFTFIKNTKTIKDERIEQQLFLKAEREEQQKFLAEERAAQVASMEADRKNHKEIADRNFNMEVLSSNRQAWINKLRDQLSDYLSFAPSLIHAQFDFILYKEQLEKINATGSTNDDIRKDFYNSLKVLNECRLKEKYLAANIKLMLNPDEEWYGVIMMVFTEVSTIYNAYQKLDLQDYQTRVINISSQLDILLSSSQKLLKFEWERVKQGI